MAGSHAPFFAFQCGRSPSPKHPRSPLSISDAQPINSGAYTLVVSNSFGTVASSPAILAVRFGLTVLTEGTGQVERNPVQANYAPNSSVILSAITTPAFAFTHWSGDATGTNNPLAVTMTGHKVIIAHFPSTTVALAVEGNGSVSKTPDQTYYRPGDVVSLTGVPARYHAFERWKDGIVANPRSVVVGATNIYTALFFPTTALEILTFSNVSRLAPIGMAALFVDDRFITNSAVTNLAEAEISMLTSFPNGSIFFTLDGSEPSFGSSLYRGPFPLRRSVLIRAVAYDANFTVYWEADPLRLEIEPSYALDASTPGGGAVSVAPATAFYRSNDLVNLIATPAAGWRFLHWLGDASGTNPTTSLRVTRDSCVQAMFGTMLNHTQVGSGIIGIYPLAPLYFFGTIIRLTAVPAPGYYFAAWGNAASSTNNPLLFQITNANSTVSCAFGPLPAGQSALSVTINGRGRVLPIPRPNRFNLTQSITLTAVPDSDQSFLGWAGDASGSQTNLVLSMTQSRAITANFTSRPRLTLGPCLGGWSPDGFQLTLHGDIGAVYEVETSSDTALWSPLLTVTNHFGISHAVDPSTNFQQRFYRVIPRP